MTVDLDDLESRIALLEATNSQWRTNGLVNLIQRSSRLGDQVRTPYLLSPFSWQSLGPEFAALQGNPPSSATWYLANAALFYPITLNEPFTLVKFWWMNGGVSSGNVDCGLYDETGQRIASAGTTPQGTINIVQEVVSSNPIQVNPGNYYLAFAADNVTATVFSAVGAGGGADGLRALGVVQMAAAFPLPAMATFATLTNTPRVAYAGISKRLLIV